MSLKISAFVVFSTLSISISYGQIQTEEEVRCTHDVTACMEAAKKYANGDGVDQNYDLAAKLFVKACYGKVSAACFNAGYYYAEGIGVEEDQAWAAHLYVKGCNADYGPACINAAYQYDMGIGVTKNRKRAVQLYEKACILGANISC
ncbi:tetratricopeptide repeat protein [Maritalea porphyrae]|uniref:tetratricopeptide repeat protein n=1 Tax=Maritalea porphyrae TaxID=880732 RepID=UPI0022B00A72|nr:tetratricopeptide repeat protein [Maritalea porphyrae]MCZ4274210.1 tetratricopeptide repeat protein [Maritalea porphyrae]